MYTTCISINTQFLLFIGKLQGGPNSYPLLVHPVYEEYFVNHRSDSMWGTDYIANPFFLNKKFLGRQLKIWVDNSVEKLFR